MPSWHLAAAVGLLGGLLARWLFGAAPAEDEGAGLLLMARRANDAN
jgi:hypothetical protein